MLLGGEPGRCPAGPLSLYTHPPCEAALCPQQNAPYTLSKTDTPGVYGQHYPREPPCRCHVQEQTGPLSRELQASELKTVEKPGQGPRAVGQLFSLVHKGII